jgi:3-hydroxyisobutyrate dehydrogenase
MGAAAARRLLSQGHRVTVWNRTAARADVLRSHGATVADTPAEAVSESDLVLVFLSDAAAAETAIFGAGGAAEALRPGSIVVQMSTIGPEATTKLAARFPQQAHLLDAPVKGSVPAVESGKLQIFVSGDASAIEAASAVLVQLGTLTPCGELGVASAVKLVVNAAMILSVSALAETTSLAQALGLPADIARQAIEISPLSGALARAEAQGADFPIAHARKDLDLAAAALPDPLLTNAAELLLRGATRQDEDLGAVVNHGQNHTK